MAHYVVVCTATCCLKENMCQHVHPGKRCVCLVAACVAYGQRTYAGVDSLCVLPARLP